MSDHSENYSKKKAKNGMKNYSDEFLSQLFKTMVRIRFCEESLVEPILNGEVVCPVHLCSGQEAVATGVCAALKDTDYVFGTHRSHGHYLAKGGSMEKLVAEIFGKETGCSRGRGGSMHILDTEVGMIGSAPIVAGTIPLAVGAALASSIRNEKRVTVSFFGDGAAGEGVLYESLNFAALKKLPILFVCENNGYSTHMRIEECRPNDQIFLVGKSCDVHSLRIGGNDVLEVYETAKKAVEICNNGGGPVLIECVTYRLRGHVGPDDNIQGTHTDIRPVEEIQKWRKKDPLIRFERYLKDNGILSVEKIETMKANIAEEVKRAHTFAISSDHPKQNELSRYVFKN